MSRIRKPARSVNTPTHTSTSHAATAVVWLADQASIIARAERSESADGRLSGIVVVTLSRGLAGRAVSPLAELWLHPAEAPGVAEALSVVVAEARRTGVLVPKP